MPEDQRQPPETTTIQRKTPSLAELIAQTPSAQTREQALKHIASREKEFSPRRRQPTPPSEEDLSKPEPMNIISDPYGSAPDVMQRILANAKAIRSAKQREEREAQSKPPKGFKLYLVPKKDKPDPADKK